MGSHSPATGKKFHVWGCWDVLFIYLSIWGRGYHIELSSASRNPLSHIIYLDKILWDAESRKQPMQNPLPNFTTELSGEFSSPSYWLEGPRLWEERKGVEIPRVTLQTKMGFSLDAGVTTSCHSTTARWHSRKSGWYIITHSQHRNKARWEKTMRRTGLHCTGWI